jgi:hypothetical protein
MQASNRNKFDCKQVQLECCNDLSYSSTARQLLRMCDKGLIVKVQPSEYKIGKFIYSNNLLSPIPCNQTEITDYI